MNEKIYLFELKYYIIKLTTPVNNTQEGGKKEAKKKK
jgi:hypothetical protein